MNKKSLLSVLLALVLCFTTVVPAAAAPVFAESDTAVTAEEPSVEATEELDLNTVNQEELSVETDEEKPLPSMAVVDGVVAGSGEYIMEHDGVLNYDESWTHTFDTARSCMLYFYASSTEYSYAYYSIKVINNDTGKSAYTKSGYVDEDYYFEDSVGLDPGNYTIIFDNTDYTYNNYYFDVYYEPLHTAEDPYYCIDPDFALIYTGKTINLKAQALPSPATFETATWSSNNPAVASVDENGVVTAVSAGEAIITADIDGHIAKSYIYVDNPTYKISSTTATLYAKQTKQLKVTVDPADYGLSGLTWKSSNTKVATVNSKGLVTAKAKGTATITATVNGVSKTCKVTVKPMALNKTKATVYVKKTQQLKVNGGTGKTTWKSGNKKIATVSSSGVVKGIKPGTTTITAKKNGKTFKCKVTVKWEPETGTTTTKTYNLTWDKSIDVNMKGAGSITVTATNKSCDYSPLNVSIWNPNYKTIMDTSVKLGKTVTKTVNTTAKGKFTIYCSSSGNSKIVVKVTTKPVLSNKTLTVGKGYTGTLKAYGVKNGGKWSSSNKKIATVTSKGVVKGKKKGTCYIKYTLKTGKVLKCKVTVTNPVTCKVVKIYDTSIYNECDVKFTNYTNKKITYIKFNIKQYDNRGYRLHDGPYDWYYMNDDLKAHSSGTWYDYWISDDAKKCTAYITKVYFADGTTWTP